MISVQKRFIKMFVIEWGQIIKYHSGPIHLSNLGNFVLEWYNFGQNGMILNDNDI